MIQITENKIKIEGTASQMMIEVSLIVAEIAKARETTPKEITDDIMVLLTGAEDVLGRSII